MNLKKTSRPALLSDMLDEILRQQDFRREKAAQYPDDHRNERCADGLREMFERQDSASPLMLRLTGALMTFNRHLDTASGFLPSVTDRLARFRYHHGPAETFEEFFNDLITAIEEHAAQTLVRNRDEAY